MLFKGDNCRLTSLLFALITIHVMWAEAHLGFSIVVAGAAVVTILSVVQTLTHANIICKCNYKSLSLLHRVAPISPVSYTTVSPLHRVVLNSKYNH